MSAFSNYLENIIASYMNGSAVTTVATKYLALFSTATTDAGDGTEITSTITGSATRTTLGASWGTVSGNQVSNTSEIVITTSASNGATATHWGIFTAATGGNLLMHGALSASKTITAGDKVSFPAGTFILSFD